MQKWLEQYREKIAREEQVLYAEKSGVNRRNLHILRFVAVGCMVVFGLSFLLAVFSESVSGSGYLSFRLAYLVLVILFGILYLLIGRYPDMDSIRCIYIIYLGADLYCILASAFAAPNYVSVTILALLFQVPILYVDRSRRMNFFVILCAAAYLLCIWPFKNPALFVDECMNVGAFTAVAIIIGTFTRESQIENFAMKAKLHTFAYSDQLTGLANRRSLFEDLANGTNLAGLAIIDIDNFKRYNDTYGHQAGDVCLRMVTDCFSQYQAPDRLRFYRYGGEEFLVAFWGYSQPEMLELLSCIRESIADCRIPHSGSLLGRVTVSIGFSSWDEAGADGYAAVLSRADSALYTAKNSGKNRVECYAAPTKEAS